MNRKNLLVLGLIVLALAAAAVTRQNTYADTRLSSTMAESSFVNNVFTYQGRLSDNGQPADGTYDFQVYIFTEADGGALLEQYSGLGTAVDAGLFQLDIEVDPNIFNSGGRRWLEIWVSPAGANTWTTLNPRQEIQPVPQAIYAEYAGQLAAPQPVVVQVSPFDAIQSDGLASLSFAAMGNGRLEISRTSQGNGYVYIPVDVPSQLVTGHGLTLDNMRFCYSGFNNGFGVVSGISIATVRQISDMNAAVNLVGDSYNPVLTDENSCVTVEADSPTLVTGSVWVRFEVQANDLVPLELGEISLTFQPVN
ncbi:MAG: hypothetical protein H6658_16065 [Ardenticatenaceae bacterium]|nr:hypothetical protein [Ardenticatenaceae bacterium]